MVRQTNFLVLLSFKKSRGVVMCMDVFCTGMFDIAEVEKFEGHG